MTTSEETYDAATSSSISAGAANSAKILLASANDRHPNGLANGSDQVGRNYMFHNSVAVLAISKEPNPTMFQKTLGVNDFYFGMPGFDYPMGNIQMVGKSDGRDVPGREAASRRSSRRCSRSSEVATHAVDFWLSTEDLPTPDNRVTLTSDGNITADLHARTTRSPRSGSTTSSSRCSATSACIPTTCCRGPATSRTRSRSRAVAHQAGTVRFGTDPATSVLDVNCKAHEVDNLYVVDTSFFPSIGAVNPALTAMANALRVRRPPPRAARRVRREPPAGRGRRPPAGARLSRPVCRRVVAWR